MTEMLNDVLIISKLEVGKLEHIPISFNLVEHSRQSPEAVKMNLGYLYLIFFTSQYKSVTCYMNEKLLIEILINLLSNAIKYSLDKSIFKLNLLCDDEQAGSEIKDCQIAIYEEDIRCLLESLDRTINIGNILRNRLKMAI